MTTATTTTLISDTIARVKAQIAAYHEAHPRQRRYASDEAPGDTINTGGRAKRLYWHEVANGTGVALRLFHTDVATFYADRIVLRTGGWHTASTRDAIRIALEGTPYRVSSIGGTRDELSLYVYDPSQGWPEHNRRTGEVSCPGGIASLAGYGVEILPDGTLRKPL